MIRKRNGKLLRMAQNGTIGTSFACATETIIGSVNLPADFLIKLVLGGFKRYDLITVF